MRSRCRLTSWTAAAVIAATTIVSYYSATSGPLIFDDVSSVTHNPSIRSLWPLSSVFSPPSECTVAGRPLANLTFALNYAWGGLAVGSYHWVNIALHIGTALLVFGIIHKTLAFSAGGGPPNADQSAARGSAHWVALVIAVLWSAHPLLTAAVTYISQRTEVLMAFFYAGTLYTFIRGAMDGQARWLGVSVLSCWLGMLSKEGMVTAPIMVLLYDRSFIAGSFRSALKVRGPYYAAVAASWVVLGILMVDLKARAVGFGLGVPWWSYALTECKAITTYVRLVLWPATLIFDYGALFVTGLRDGLGPLLFVLCGLLVTGILVWRRRKLGFVVGAFVLLLAPTSSVVPIATQPIAENRVYLAAVPIVALLVLGANRVAGRTLVGAALLAALALIPLTIARNAVLTDRVRLWSDTVAKRGQNPRAHTILGESLHAAGRLQEAKVQFETALKLKPDYPEALSNLGTTVFVLGDIQRARECFEAALRLRPDSPSVHNNLGNLYLQLGELEKAALHCEEALRLFLQPERLKPDLAETHNTLGNIRLYQGNPQAAQVQYRAAVKLRPDFPQARMNLGVALRLTGQLDEAGRELKRVATEHPDFAEAQFNFGVWAEQVGEHEWAAEAFKRAINLRQDFAEALFADAQLARRKGDLLSAKNSLEAVVRLRPQDTAVRELLNEVNTVLSSRNAPGTRRP